MFVFINMQISMITVHSDSLFSAGFCVFYSIMVIWIPTALGKKLLYPFTLSFVYELRCLSQGDKGS